MKRWPIIRHVRWAWHSFWFWRWFNYTGQYLGTCSNPADTRHLNAIREGRA